METRTQGLNPGRRKKKRVPNQHKTLIDSLNVYRENQTKHINTLWGQNTEILMLKHVYSWRLKPSHQQSKEVYFLNNQPDAPFIQIYSVIKLYMYRGIFSAHYQEFSTVHSALVSFMQVFDDRFQAESGCSILTLYVEL